MLSRPLIAVGWLLLVSALVQTVAIARAVSPAQDSVRFAGMAAQIQREGLPEALRRGSDPPLFPLLTLAALRLVDSLTPNSAGRWATAVQLAAAAPLALSVIPVYLTARLQFGGLAAALTGLVWCVLPEVSRLGADGLADSTQLALFATALWTATAGFCAIHGKTSEDHRRRRQAPGWFLATGLSCGLAMLARPEAVLLLPAVALAIWQYGDWDRGQRIGLTVGLAAGPALVVAPYLWLAQAHTTEQAVQRLLGRFDSIAAAGGFLSAAAQGVPAAPQLVDTRLPTAEGRTLVFPHKEASITSRVTGWPHACGELLRELAHVWCYWVGGLALLGAWAQRRQVPAWYGWLALPLACFLLLAAAWNSAHWGYLSTRHLLLLVPLGLGFAGSALAQLLARLQDASRTAAGRRSTRIVVAYAAVALCIVACLPAALAPKHSSRAAYRLAAEWLVDRSQLGDRVLDTRGWTALYSGRDTYRYTAARAALVDPRLSYVVVGCEELARSSPRAESLRWLLDRYARPEAEFSSRGGGDGVAIYRWQPERFASAAAAKALGN